MQAAIKKKVRIQIVINIFIGEGIKRKDINTLVNSRVEADYI
jgi:hypothetical protein